MPRNVEENIYITLGFARSSPTWQRLQREARELDISVPHYIKVLLADRAAALEGHGKDLWFPREMHITRVKAANLPVASTPEPTVEGDSSRRATAAAAAANYWED
jgi:hypothetical protein